jgi:hypothetical protein
MTSATPLAIADQPAGRLRRVTASVAEGVVRARLSIIEAPFTICGLMLPIT